MKELSYMLWMCFATAKPTHQLLTDHEPSHVLVTVMWVIFAGNSRGIGVMTDIMMLQEAEQGKKHYNRRSWWLLHKQKHTMTFPSIWMKTASCQVSIYVQVHCFLKSEHTVYILWLYILYKEQQGWIPDPFIKVCLWSVSQTVGSIATNVCIFMFVPFDFSLPHQQNPNKRPSRKAEYFELFGLGCSITNNDLLEIEHFFPI